MNNIYYIILQIAIKNQDLKYQNEISYQKLIYIKISIVSENLRSYFLVYIDISLIINMYLHSNVSDNATRNVQN